MLPKANRLKQDRDFKVLLQAGRRLNSQGLTVRWVTTRQPVSRFAFVVANHVAKRAVVRNKLKRRLREIIRSFLPHLTGSYDILLAAKKPALDYTFQQLQQEVLSVLQRAKLWS